MNKYNKFFEHEHLAWLSDIHLNFLSGTTMLKFCYSLRENKNIDGVLISGDIAEGNSIERYLGYLEDMINKPIYFVLGNHDRYHSSFLEVNKSMKRFSPPRNISDNLHWVTNSGVIGLNQKVCLIGNDGWYDCQLGNYFDSSYSMNDWEFISEVKNLDKTQRLRMFQEIAKNAASDISLKLELAIEKYDKIIMITHIPPFMENARFRGQQTEPKILPFYTCKVMGDTLLNTMKQNPHKKLVVLCGHSHGFARFQPLPNLVAYTSYAEYGNPKISEIVHIQ